MADARIKLSVDGASQVVGELSTVDKALGGISKTGAALTGAIAGFVAGLSISTFTDFIKGSIESTASIKDLTIQTGASAQALAQFKSIGKLTDTAVDTIAGSMNKLAKNLSEVTDSTGGTGKALKAIGINFADLKTQSPEQQFLTIANQLDKFEDGAGKSAVAMTLFGKEGAKLLPFFKDLADESESVTKALNEQDIKTRKKLADQADNFSDNLIKLRKESEGWKKELANGLLPALDETLQAWIDVTTGQNGFKAEIKKLSSDGTLTEWARNAVTALTYVLDIFAGLKRIVVTVGSTIAAYVASTVEKFSSLGTVIQKLLAGDFKGAANEFSLSLQRQKSISESLGETLSETWSNETLGAKLRARLDDLRTVGVEAKKAKDSIDLKPPNPNDAKQGIERKEAISDYEKLTKAIAEKSAAVGLEIDLGRALTEGEKLRSKFQTDDAAGKFKFADATKKSVDAQRAEIQAGLDEIIVKEQLEKSNKFALDAMKQLNDSRFASIKAISDEATKNEELVRTYGLSRVQIEEDTIARLENQRAQADTTKGYTAELQALDLLIEERKRNAKALANLDGLDAAKKAQEELTKENQKFNDQIYQGLTDSLYRAFESGKGFFSSFWDGIKNLFKTTVLKLAIQGTVGSILGGGSGLASAATGQGDIGGLVSGISSLFGGSAAAGAASGAGALGGLGALGSSIAGAGNFLFGTGASTLSSYAGTSALALGLGGSVASAISAAVPFIGGAVAAYFVGKSAFGHKPREITGTTINGTLGTDNISRDDAYLRKGGFLSKDKTGVFSYNLATSAAVADGKTYVDTARQAENAALLKSLNDAYGQIKTSSADYAKALGIDASSIADRTDKINYAVGKTAEETQKNLEKAFGDVSNLIADDLLGAFADLKKSGETSSQALARLGGDLTGVNATFKSLGLSLYTVDVSGSKAAESLISAFGSLDNLVSASKTYYDNYYNDAEKAAIKTKQLTQAFADAGLVLPDTREAFRVAVEAAKAAGDDATYAKLLKLNAQFADAVPAALSEAGKAVDVVANVFSSASESIKVSAVKIDTQLATIGSALAGAIDRRNEEIKAIEDFKSSLFSGSDSPLSAQTSYDYAKAQLATATPDNVQALVKSFLDASKNVSGTALQYTQDVGFANNSLSDVQARLRGENDSAVAFYHFLQNSGASTAIDGSHESGLDYVPFDGYVAQLHKGERVQTASQASSSDDVANEIRQLRQEIQAQNLAIIKNTRDTAQILTRWNGDGQPEVRNWVAG